MPNKFLIITLAILILLPTLGLMGLGSYWLWQHDWLYQATGLISANVALIYTLWHWRSKSKKSTFLKAVEIPPNQNWSDEGQQAFEALKPVIERWQHETDLLTNSSKALQLTNEVLTTVAQYFHADSKYPILEFPLPYLLKLITSVCNDIQHDVLDKIPGSHAVTVGELLHAKDKLNVLKKVKDTLDVGSWVFNFSGAALRKARGLLLGKGIDFVTNELSQRLVSAYVLKLGRYAIDLYSGQLTLDDIVLTHVLTAYTQQDIENSHSNEQTIEPLRLLVLGQVSSGKSSLINALFGEVKTAVSILPTTREITPYVLERDGLQQAIILDSAGYGGLRDKELPEALKKEWAKIDVILLVCNAAQAARELDVAHLNAIRQYFQTEVKNQTLPVVITVATHIDRLRPIQEWQPPYNIQQPENPKEQNIRAACEVIAKDLLLPLENVVPVCLNPEKSIYNIEEGLMPLIHEKLSDAQRVRYLRCLKNHKHQDHWQQVIKQTKKLGNLFLSL
jgi:predicted GTPase